MSKKCSKCGQSLPHIDIDGDVFPIKLDNTLHPGEWRLESPIDQAILNAKLAGIAIARACSLRYALAIPRDELRESESPALSSSKEAEETFMRKMILKLLRPGGGDDD